MNLPWVSRGRYEDMRERAENAEAARDKLQDQLVRIRRRQEKMPEEPPESREKKEPMPPGVRKLIEGFPEQTAQRLMQNAKRAHRDGRSWEEIGQRIEQEVS